MHPQTQCPLFHLPSEIRSDIFHHCLISTKGPILDPTTLASDPAIRVPADRHIPPLGLSLLRTCRKIYSEVDIRPLYTHNDFSFTEADTCADFLDSLPSHQRNPITAVTFDLRYNIYGENYDSNRYDMWAMPLKDRECSHFVQCDKPWKAPTAQCMVLGKPHLLAHAPPVKLIIFDVCAAQQRTKGTYHLGLEMWFNDCVLGIPATQTGLEVRLRARVRCEHGVRIRESVIPCGVISSDVVAEAQRKLRLREWMAGAFKEQMGRSLPWNARCDAGELFEHGWLDY